MKPSATQTGTPFGRDSLLWGIYLGRLMLVTGVLAGALVAWRDAEDT